MRSIKLLSVFPALLVLAACVTINVYFPAVAAEKAADRIIHNVWGEQTPPPEEPNGEAPDSHEPSEAPAPQSRGPQPTPTLALQLLDYVIAPARAQQPRIDISSPAIKRLTATMERRHQKLLPYYQSGAIGLTRDALIDVRDLGAVPLAKRGRVRTLVAAENDDRNALYREIAVANDHPEWESRIRDVFAKRWVSNAQNGWYYQSDSGEWLQK